MTGDMGRPPEPRAKSRAALPRHLRKASQAAAKGPAVSILREIWMTEDAATKRIDAMAVRLDRLHQDLRAIFDSAKPRKKKTPPPEMPPQIEITPPAPVEPPEAPAAPPKPKSAISAINLNDPAMMMLLGSLDEDTTPPEPEPGPEPEPEPVDQAPKSSIAVDFSALALLDNLPDAPQTEGESLFDLLAETPQITPEDKPLADKASSAPAPEQQLENLPPVARVRSSDFFTE